MRPPKNIEIPFDMLFPLLVYYFAQVQDKRLGGEYSAELSWPKIISAIDIQRKISVSYDQLDSLIYSFKVGILDKRPPFFWIFRHCEKNYQPLMEKFKQFYPDLFREERDGEIVLIGNSNLNSENKTL
jgi:hypothetical protein